ncbi:flagellar hook-length control protein FliK [Paraglaciecola chathamensis]|uniref:flagellar hook-length control protein FliK n=1 Tax=Paraglaciecola chathamensis TaxID=368405 RepID=UPI002709E2B0|nr:flagellar hook-length control protein FliK [Paraglaciecola chathamensis]MDO6838202.1 flagellar hook-length control protein FliK [Paraglaciecola chathamensis]
MLQQIATAKSDVAAYAVDVSDESASKLQNADEFAFMLAKENKSHQSAKATPETKADVQPHISKKDKQAAQKSVVASEKATQDALSNTSPNEESNALGKQAQPFAAERDNTVATDKNGLASKIAAQNESDGKNIDISAQVQMGTAEANVTSSEQVDTLVTTEVKDDAQGNHWLSIVEQLVANAQSKGNSEAQGNSQKAGVADESSLKGVIDSAGFPINAEHPVESVSGSNASDDSAGMPRSDQLALVAALLNKMNNTQLDSRSAQGANEHSVDGKIAEGKIPADDVSKMMAALEGQPELMSALKRLLTTQEQINEESKVALVDAGTEGALETQTSEVSGTLIQSAEEELVLNEQELVELAQAVFSLMDAKAATTKETAKGDVAIQTLGVKGSEPQASSSETVSQLIEQATEQSTLVSGLDAGVSELDAGASELDAELTQQQLVLLESTPELKKLLQLPPEKLESALAILAKQLQQGGTASTSSVSESSIGTVVTNTGQIESDLTPPASLDLNNLLSKVDTKADVSGSTDFISALKTGLAEVKAQLEKGREPGIDLKALVNDAIKSSPELASNMLSTKPEQVELATRSMMQVVDVAQLMSSALEQVSHQQSVNATYREQGINMVEQTKASQLQQGQFDKALNLAKPEAHQQLAEKVRFMVNANQLVADIRLDPAELGSMHVKVSVSGESANVSFVVQTLHAKEAIDNAAPKLKEMLAEKGIELGQSSVEQGSQDKGDEQQMAGNGNGHDHSAEQGLAEGEVPEGVLQQPIVNGALGGIDYFV